jgi:hypothetical protein
MATLKACNDDPTLAARWLIDNHSAMRAREHCPLVRRLVLASSASLHPSFSAGAGSGSGSSGQSGSGSGQSGSGGQAAAAAAAASAAAVSELRADILAQCGVVVTGHQLVVTVPPYVEPWSTTDRSLVRCMCCVCCMCCVYTVGLC